MHFPVDNYTFYITRDQLEKRLTAISEQTSPLESIDWGLHTSHSSGGERGKLILKNLSGPILRTGDRKLIDLYRRAIRSQERSEMRDRYAPYVSDYYFSRTFQIMETELVLRVQGDRVKVETVLRIGNIEQKEKIILDGPGKSVKRVFLDNAALAPDQWLATESELIILVDVQKDWCELKIEGEITPFFSESREGIYKTEDFLFFRGARKIFFSVDRLRVPNGITTRVVADQRKYPMLFGSGVLVKEEKLDNDEVMTTLRGLFYRSGRCFSLVLGDFAILNDRFLTVDGREITLRFFVAKGREERTKFAFYILKKALAFDEQYFGRSYEQSCLDVAALPFSNSAASWSGKGGLIFPEQIILVDGQNSTDEALVEAAAVFMREYIPDWCGNIGLEKNRFETAIREAFVDFRSRLFLEFLFDGEFASLDRIERLKQKSLLDDNRHKGPFVDLTNDFHLYIKATELFEMLRRTFDKIGWNKFKEAFDIYFRRYGGQPITFNSLMKTMRDYAGIDFTGFSRWFYHAGDLELRASLYYDVQENGTIIKVAHPDDFYYSVDSPEAFKRPIYIELMGNDGEEILPKTLFTMRARELNCFIDGLTEKPIPLFLQPLPSSVKIEYRYSNEELKNIMIHRGDPLAVIAAGRIYARQQILKIFYGCFRNGEVKIADEVKDTYLRILAARDLSPLMKAKLLDFSDVREIAKELDVCDFSKIAAAIEVFQNGLTASIEEFLLMTLERQQMTLRADFAAARFVPDIKSRSLRNRILSMLYNNDKRRYFIDLYETYRFTANYNDSIFALSVLADSRDARRDELFEDFYEQLTDGGSAFNDWIRVQTESRGCSVSDLKKIEKRKLFAAENYDHLYFLLGCFINNLPAFHDDSGAGYRYVTEKILEIANFDSELAVNFARWAWHDIARINHRQKELMTACLRDILEAKLPDNRLHLLAKGLLQNAV